MNEKKYTIRKMIFLFLEPFWWKAILVSIFSLTASLSILIGTSASSRIIDMVPLLTKISFSTLFDRNFPFIWSIIFCLSALMGSVFGSIAGKIMSVSLPYLQYDIRLKLFEIIQKFEMSYFQENGSGFIENYVSRVSDAFSDMFNDFFDKVVPGCIFILIGTVCISTYNIWFGIINVVWMTFHWILYLNLSKKAIHLSKIKSEYSNLRTEKTVEALQNILTTKILDLGEYTKSRVEKDHLLESNFYEKYISTNNYNIFLTNLLLTFFEMIFILVTLPRGVSTAGDISVVMQINGWINHYMAETTRDLVNIIEAIGDLSKSFELLNMAKNEQSNDEGLQPILEGDIDISNFYFSTKDGRVTITGEGCSSIKSGEVVVFVGKSGSGKSTLMNVLLHIIRPTPGQIELSGVDLASINTRYLRSKVMAYISQKSMLFNTTLRENLKIGKKDFSTDEEIMAAAKMAQIDDVILELERTGKGLGTVVGTHNSIFSGGQIQRFCIARVMLNSDNWKILLADEITSALDPITSAGILDMIINFCKEKKRTLILATHGDYAVKKADRILFLSDGKLILNTKEWLFDNNLLFREMFPDVLK